MRAPTKKDLQRAIALAECAHGVSIQYEIKLDAGQTLATPYDYQSVMHYPIDACLQLAPGRIAPVDPAPGHQALLSPVDIDAANQMYRCGVRVHVETTSLVGATPTPLVITRYFDADVSISNIRSIIQAYTVRDLNREFANRNAPDLVRALAQPAATRVAAGGTARADATLLSAAGIIQPADPLRAGEIGQVVLVLGAFVPVAPPFVAQPAPDAPLNPVQPRVQIQGPQVMPPTQRRHSMS